MKEHIEKTNKRVGITEAEEIAKGTNTLRSGVEDVINRKGFSNIMSVSDKVSQEGESSLIEDERSKLQKYLHENGEILSKSHPFSKTCEVCFSKLLKTKPELRGIELICLDTENEGIAFYSPDSKSIVISKGVLTGLINNGLDIHEDHIAAIIAHEIIHGERDVRVDKENEEKYITSLKYNLAGHNQEMEADRKGMLLLSESGFNPKAMIEMLYSFDNLKNQFSSLSHPNELIRINHLKDSLYDDEHPIQNTDKELAVLDDNVLSFLTAPSENVYKFTEKLLNSDKPSLKDIILDTKTVEDFLIALKAYKLVEKVSLSKVLVQDKYFKKVMRKAWVIKTLNSSSLKGTDGKEVDNKLSGNFTDLLKYFKHKRYLDTENDGTMEEPVFISANKAREKYQPDQNGYDIYKEQIEKVLVELEKKLDESIEIIFRQSEESSMYRNKINIKEECLIKYGEKSVLDEGLINVYKNLLEIYDKENREIDLSIIKTCFDGFDISSIKEEVEKEKTERKENGQSDIPTELIEQALKGFYNIDDPEISQKFIEAIEESIGTRLCKDINLDLEIVLHFEELITENLGISKENSKEIVKLFIGDDKQSNLEDIDYDSLVKTFKLYFDMRSITSGNLSPIRDNHSEYKDMLREAIVANNLHNKYIKTELNKGEVITNKLVKAIINKKIGLSSEESDSIFAVFQGKSITDFNLTIDEWKDLSVLTNNDEIKGLYLNKALQLYLKSIKNNEEVNKDVLKVLGQFNNKSNIFKLKPTMEDLQILLENTPWNSEKTQYILMNYLFSYGSLRASIYEMTDEQLVIYKNIAKYTNDNPAPFRQKELVNTIGDSFFDKLRQFRSELMNIELRRIQKLNELSSIESVQLGYNKEGEVNMTQVEGVLENWFKDTGDNIVLLETISDISDKYLRTENIVQSFLGKYCLIGDRSKMTNFISKMDTIESKNKIEFSISEILKLVSLYPNLNIDFHLQYPILQVKPE